MKNFKIILSILGAISTLNYAVAQVTFATPSKKVIDLFQHPPTVTEAFDILSKKPVGVIDGYIIRLPESVGEGYIFDIETWKKVTPTQFDEFAKSIQNLPEIKNAKDNFLMLYGASTMDWFNDEHWKLVEQNIIYCAKIAQKIGMKGICWDKEPYRGHNPWEYKKQPNYATHTYQEYNRLPAKVFYD